MTINNPDYASKSTAVRAAKRQGLENYKIVPIGERFELINLDRPLYDSSQRKKSTVEGAVGVVWDICAEMIPEGFKRKEIIAKAVDAGVALNTARTQYQHYRKAAGLVKTAD